MNEERTQYCLLLNMYKNVMIKKTYLGFIYYRTLIAQNKYICKIVINQSGHFWSTRLNFMPETSYTNNLRK